MDIQAKKLHFIREILSIENVAVLEQLFYLSQKLPLPKLALPPMVWKTPWQDKPSPPMALQPKLTSTTYSYSRA